MVELVETQSSTTVAGIHPATGTPNRIRSHFDDLLSSPEELSKPRLANELATELWSRLPISRAAEESGDRGIDHTVRIVTASTSELQAWYRELSEFVAAIARAATEHRGNALTDAMHAELSSAMQKQMLDQIPFPLPNRSFVDFKFADLPPAEAWTQAHRRLEQACLEFANQAFTLFDTLQHKKIVGKIQETASTCRFSYFRRVAVAELAGTKTMQREDRDAPAQDFGAHGVLVETVQLTDFAIQHRHAKYVHHVRNPTLNEPNSTVHPLPAKYRELIDACPEWLSGSLRVLEGELFRDERIEWDLFTETRTDEKVIERVRRDPAILFGPYVLAGWGELAITEEENRQRQEQNDVARQVSARKARQNHWLSFAAAGLAIAVTPFTVWATAVTTSLAILFGLAAMVLAGNAAHLTSVARGRMSARSVLLHSAFIGAVVFSVQGVIFSLLHWSLPAFGIAALSVVIAAITYGVQAANSELDGSRVG